MPRVNPVGTGSDSQILAADADFLLWISGGVAREEFQDRIRTGRRLLDIGKIRDVENLSVTRGLISWA
jgi:hypothetical protein